MAEGIFGDDLPEDSPEQGQETPREQTEGPDQGQPSETDAQEPTDQAGQEAPAEQEQLILGKFKSQDDLVKSYQELERKLHSRDEEKDNLRQQLAIAANLLGQAMQVPAAATAAQAPNQPAQAEATSEEDASEWLEKFYEQGPKAVDARLERKLAEFELRLAQRFAPVEHHMYQDYFNRQALSLAAKYADFKDLAPEIAAMYEQKPYLALQPDGMETAYRLVKEARARAETGTAQVAATKAAARLPGSSGPRAGRQPTVDEAIKADIFGTDNEHKGLFDD